MASKTNRVEVPEAKAAMDRFKTEVASELGVNLKEGYNGDLTSKEAGSIGGEMVRRMIKKQEEQMLLVQENIVKLGGVILSGQCKKISIDETATIENIEDDKGKTKATQPT